MRSLPVVALIAIAIASSGCSRYRRAASEDFKVETARVQVERVSALLASGEEKLLAGDYEGAAADLSAVLELDPQQATAHSQRGVARAKLANFDGALADYTRALELDPDLYIAHYNRGRIYAQRQDYQEAIADFTAVLEAKPDFARALANRGFARAELKEYERAISDLQAASEIFLEEGNAAAYHRVKNAIRYMLP